PHAGPSLGSSDGAPHPATGDTSTATAAGSLLAGRYRLGTRVGSDAAAGAEFWRAEDTVLRRDVAATVLRRFGPGTDPDDAEAAHRHGLVLGCDHPQRVRVTPEGRTQMGFALPRPELTPADDVRGLGAVLYCLLTAQWPLSPSDAARAGLSPAQRGPDGAPLS